MPCRPGVTGDGWRRAHHRRRAGAGAPGHVRPHRGRAPALGRCRRTSTTTALPPSLRTPLIARLVRPEQLCAESSVAVESWLVFAHHERGSAVPLDQRTRRAAVPITPPPRGAPCASRACVSAEKDLASRRRPATAACRVRAPVTHPSRASRFAHTPVFARPDRFCAESSAGTALGLAVHPGEGSNEDAAVLLDPRHGATPGRVRSPPGRVIAAHLRGARPPPSADVGCGAGTVPNRDASDMAIKVG